jgi:RNA polymerase sigma factor (sigma-70 family)
MIAISSHRYAQRDHSHRRAPAFCHDRFLELLPSIHQYARTTFRSLSPESREDAIQETIANAFVAYARLVEQGKESLAFATPLARYAVAQYKACRRVGARLNIRDISSEYCRRRKGLRLERLDRFDQQEGEWREIVVEDRSATPGEIAAMRLDSSAWLDSLSPRDRQLALILAAGESTSAVARLFRISLGRVSQLRAKLRTAWRRFQGELPATETAAA